MLSLTTETILVSVVAETRLEIASSLNEVEPGGDSTGFEAFVDHYRLFDIDPVLGIKDGERFLRAGSASGSRVTGVSEPI